MTIYDEKRHWSWHEDGGFWHPNSHFTIQNECIYDSHTTLEQTVVVSKDVIQPYYIWHRHFDQDRLTAELETACFHAPLTFGDVTGASYSLHSETMAVISEKNDLFFFKRCAN